MRNFCAYHDLPPRFDLLERFGLGGKRNTQFYELSAGQQRWLSLALAIAHYPQVLILDEPTIGLDVTSRVELHEKIRELQANNITIMCSQRIFVTSIILGGIMISNNILADTAGKISKLLPATHAMNAFNSLAMGNGIDFSPQSSILVLLVGSVLAFGLAVYLFSLDQHNATWRGPPLLGLWAIFPYALTIFLLL